MKVLNWKHYLILLSAQLVKKWGNDRERKVYSRLNYLTLNIEKNVCFLEYVPQHEKLDTLKRLDFNNYIICG